MQCSNVGIEIWFFAICSAALLYLFTFGARPFSRWLLARRPRSLGLQVVPAFLFHPWSLRVLAVMPAIMLFAAILGVICFFHGPHRTIVQTLPDPSGRWVAVVDQVYYANGLLTSVGDRVLVVETASMNAEGTIVFSEDALPASERPTVSWSGGRLLISVSRDATILHHESHTGDLEIVVSPR